MPRRAAHRGRKGPDTLGTDRFDKAGIPAPGFFGPLDGVFEIVCGALILAGLLTRLAAPPLGADPSESVRIFRSAPGTVTSTQVCWTGS
ncbi:hypothetical protein DMB37_36615 [Nocardia sp. CS682]|nr:hypothetical protein DMB37_36615 [Nocardia sp. CS682]